MRLPICLAVYWSHLSFLPKPCEPAGPFQSSLMVGWRSQRELSYMCRENWLVLREGLTQPLVEGRAGRIQLLVSCLWQQPGGWRTCTYSPGHQDTGHLKPETTRAASCLREDVLKEMGYLGYCHAKSKGVKDTFLLINQPSPCLQLAEKHLHP